jgi:hypothetical protein
MTTRLIDSRRRYGPRAARRRHQFARLIFRRGEGAANALERLAFAWLEHENELEMAGRHAAADVLAIQRMIVLDAAEILRTWHRGEVEARSTFPAIYCPLCPRPAKFPAIPAILKCKWHRG